jgi:hypothetical protein
MRSERWRGLGNRSGTAFNAIRATVAQAEMVRRRRNNKELTQTMFFLVTLGYQSREEAVLRLLDWETKQTVKELRYSSPTSTFLERLKREGVELPENITPKCKFNGGTVWQGHFYTCTFNEVVRVSLADWTIDRLFTRSTFNDLHHVYVDETGLYISNAGLDIVEHLDHEGQLLAHLPLLSTPLWEKHSPGVDYRFVPDICGRETHPNQVIAWNGALLVNCPLRKVVSRLDNTPVISGFPTMMHDGARHGDYHYWTTVDSNVFRAHVDRPELEHVVDLSSLYGRSAPGWCRGLELAGDLAFVGFTRFRKPSKRQFVEYAVRGARICNSHVLCYDLKRQKIVEDYYFPREDTIVYGIYRYSVLQ